MVNITVQRLTAILHEHYVVGYGYSIESQRLEDFLIFWFGKNFHRRESPPLNDFHEMRHESVGEMLVADGIVDGYASDGVAQQSAGSNDGIVARW